MEEIIDLIKDLGHIFIIQSIGLYLMITFLTIYVIADLSAERKKRIGKKDGKGS